VEHGYNTVAHIYNGVKHKYDMVAHSYDGVAECHLTSFVNVTSYSSNSVVLHKMTVSSCHF